MNGVGMGILSKKLRRLRGKGEVGPGKTDLLIKFSSPKEFSCRSLCAPFPILLVGREAEKCARVDSRIHVCYIGFFTA